MKSGTKEYHKLKSQEWFKRLQANDELRIARNKLRTKQRQDKKSKWVGIFESKCKDCNKTFPDCVYDFHHLDPTTKIHTDPSKVFMFSDARIKEELDKCVMLCANCHRIRHHEDKYKAHEKRDLERKYGKEDASILIEQN